MLESDDSGLIAFAEELQEEIRAEAGAEGAESFLPEVLTRRGIETITELGEADELVECHLRQRGIEVSGYGVEEDTLNIAVTIHRGEVPAPRVTKTDIATAFKRATSFWQRCSNGAKPLHKDLEESSDAWSMALQVERAARDIRRVRLFLITDGTAAVEYQAPETIDDIEYVRSIWDVARMYRLATSGERGEPIEIDIIARFGRPLPSLEAEIAGADYGSHLAVIPGTWLGRIYDEFGSRLLEKNVRSFLQFTGKVNRGMRDTIAGENPARFFAYNNGISATASSVELVTDEWGGQAISKLHDLQIVNGGQTTASIHRSMRTGADVSEIYVQMKITEVSDDRLDEMVPLISKYANSQNAVNVADLTANDPFQIEVESLSRSIWAPATGSTMQQTRWFYERARGQYPDALNREPTQARRKAFVAVHPRNQKITKTDLAKFENSWAQKPWLVSRGAQRNFIDFMLSANKLKPDVPYYQRLVAKAILFKRTERIVSAQDFGGYRANIVTYSIAKLSHATQQRLNLQLIWDAQALDESLETTIAELAHAAYRVLTEEAGTRNVTEWAKDERCWRLMRDQEWELPSAVKPLLVPLRSASASPPEPADAMQGALPEDDPLVRKMDGVGGDAFLAIANWAKETNNLTGFDRKFAFSIGRRLKAGRSLTLKQAPIADRILEEARELGFEPSRLL